MRWRRGHSLFTEEATDERCEGCALHIIELDPPRNERRMDGSSEGSGAAEMVDRPH